MRAKRLSLLVVFFAALAGLVLPGGAQASTQGTPDTDNTYSNVGFLLFFSEGARTVCSGTLVSPTVVLTAGHCTADVDGKVLVTFKQFIDDAEPLDYEYAADTTHGWTDQEIADRGGLSGTAYPNEAYAGLTDKNNWNDFGVVVLDDPVTDIQPAPIAPLHTLDAIKQSDLNSTIFRAVGYGFEVRKADDGSQNPTPMAYPLQRRYVDVSGQKLVDQILQTNGSSTNGGDTGSSCFGDSGGPMLYRGEVVAITSYSNNDVCRGVSGYQRADIPGVQDFLAGFGVTPAS